MRLEFCSFSSRKYEASLFIKRPPMKPILNRGHDIPFFVSTPHGKFLHFWKMERVHGNSSFLADSSPIQLVPSRHTQGDTASPPVPSSNGLVAGRRLWRLRFFFGGVRRGVRGGANEADESSGKVKYSSISCAPYRYTLRAAAVS